MIYVTVTKLQKVCPVSTAIFFSDVPAALFHTFAAHLQEWEGMHTHAHTYMHMHAHTHSCSHKTSLALAHTVLWSPAMYLVRAGESKKKKLLF